MNQVEQSWRFAFQPQERLSPVEWCEKHILMPDGQAYLTELQPWVREPLNMIGDFSVPLQLCLWSPQIAKTVTSECGICYLAHEFPGHINAYTDSQDKAKIWAEERLMRMVKTCKPLEKYLPTDPYLIRVQNILFNHMVLRVLPANITTTQSSTRPYIFGDEVWNWDPGILDNAIRRTSAPHLIGRRKIVLTSTAWTEGHDVEGVWRKCEQRFWAVACPNCHEHHPMIWSADHSKRLHPSIPAFTVKWDRNDTTCPDGVWNIPAVRSTVHLQCPSCNHKIYDTPTDRVGLRKSGKYLTPIPGKDKTQVAFLVNGLAAYPWGDMLARFLQANDEMKMGLETNLKEFVTKDLAEPWTDQGSFIAQTNIKGDYSFEHIDGRFRAPDWVSEPNAINRLVIDVQLLAPHYWYCVRAWALDGRSRLMECGSVNTWVELEEIAKYWKCTEPKKFQVGVDCGHDPTEVYGQCVRQSWYALRGDEVDNWIHIDHSNNSKSTKPYSPASKRWAGRGVNGSVTHAIEYMWSNPTIKNFLARLLGGRSTLYFGVPDNAPQYYLDHQAGESRKQVKSGRKMIWVWERIGKRPNHLWDCECMGIVLAMRGGQISPATVSARVAEDELEDDHSPTAGGTAAPQQRPSAKPLAQSVLEALQAAHAIPGHPSPEPHSQE